MSELTAEEREELREVQEFNRFTQKDLAEICILIQQHVSVLESERFNALLSTLDIEKQYNLLRYFDSRIDYFKMLSERVSRHGWMFHGNEVEWPV